jgi:hypothetical protein
MAILDTAGLVEPTTVGCRWSWNQFVEPCRRLGEALSPDLVFEHGDKSRWLVDTVRRKNQYLRTRPIRRNAIWVRREYVLAEKLPEWAVSLEDHEVDVAPVAHAIPGAVRPGAVVDAELFWARGSRLPSRFSRELVLELNGDRRVFPVRNIWNDLPLDQWKEKLILIDHLLFEFPRVEGLAKVSIALNDGPPVLVATVRVSPSFSEEDLKAILPSGGPRWRRERLRAMALGTREAYLAYQRAAIEQARLELQHAQSKPWPESANAIHQAQNLERRAFWESPWLGHELRGAIDEAGRLRKALLAEVVPELL